MILINFRRLDGIKRTMKKALPDVPHTIRLEAVARGLGFARYKSMIIHLDQPENVILKGFDQDAFDRYLIENGFGEGDAVDLTQALHFLQTTETPQ